MGNQRGEEESRDADAACIPSNYSRLIARELGLQARELPGLLDGSGLTGDRFMQEDTCLTARQQIQILENGLRLSADEAFGLRLGRRLTPSTHGAVGFLASSSPNLLLAMEAFQTFIPTRMHFARIELRRGQEWLECDVHFDLDLSAEVHRALSETVAVIFFECAEFIVGRPLSEVTTSFAHDRPAHGARYADFLPGRLAFSAPRLMIRIPMHLCVVPNASANYENYQLAMRQCETMLAQLPASRHSSTYQIQKMMLSHPPGVLTEDEAAAALFVSKRTLARRLHREGTGFRQIRDDILSRQASDYLRDSQMPIDAIASLLNYHDSANFRRAFKRWFRLTPDQYRQQVNDEQG